MIILTVIIVIVIVIVITGTEISVTICGNWSTYRMKCLTYFQQLAVITPYAKLKLVYENSKNIKKNFEAKFERRSDQMPPIPTEILPHPHSLNNIVLSNLLQETEEHILPKFLSRELNCIPMTIANKVSYDDDDDDDDDDDNDDDNDDNNIDNNTHHQYTITSYRSLYH